MYAPQSISGQWVLFPLGPKCTIRFCRGALAPLRQSVHVGTPQSLARHTIYRTHVPTYQYCGELSQAQAPRTAYTDALDTFWTLWILCYQIWQTIAIGISLERSCAFTVVPSGLIPCLLLMVSWCRGFSWYHGIMVSRCHSITVSWYHGVIVSWCHDCRMIVE